MGSGGEGGGVWWKKMENKSGGREKMEKKSGGREKKIGREIKGSLAVVVNDGL